MKEELVDILDEDAKKTGKVMLKSQAHKESLRHGGAHLWIYNSKGEVLLQLRHPTKEIRPNVWDVSVAGHIVSGDNPKDTIVREAKEELDLDVDPSSFVFVGVHKVDDPTPGEWTHRVFNWTYLTLLEVDLKKLKLENDEVTDIRWVPLDKFKADIHDPERSKEYTPPLQELYDEVIKLIRKKTGEHK